MDFLKIFFLSVLYILLYLFNCYRDNFYEIDNVVFFIL